MLFSSARRLGTFLLNRELVVDWEQYHAREDRHALATDRLEKLSACTDVVKEISELLPVFVAHHDVDTVHQLVKTISEQHEADLRPCHYNSLLRVLTFYRKKESLENVWKAMTERGCVDEESCACVITALYALGVDEWLSAGLNVVALLEKSGQKLAIDSPHGMGNQSLVLSALLHAVSKSKYGPLATLCVAFWMKALGVRLSAWDYSNLLECLIREADTFPTIVETLMCVEANEYGELSFEDLAKCLCPDDARPASRVRQELLTAMRQSLAAHNVPLTKPISVGFLNCGIASLPTYLETIYDDMHVHKGLGPSGNNPLPVYHHTMLVHAALRNCTSALQMLPCTLERLHDWKHKYLSEAGKKGPHDDEEAAEPCEVGIYMLWDAAKLFGEVSQLTRHEIGPSFSQLTEEVAPKSSLIQMAYCGAYSLPLTVQRGRSEGCAAKDHRVRSKRGITAAIGEGNVPPVHGPLHASSTTKLQVDAERTADATTVVWVLRSKRHCPHTLRKLPCGAQCHEDPVRGRERAATPSQPRCHSKGPKRIFKAFWTGGSPQSPSSAASAPKREQKHLHGSAPYVGSCRSKPVPARANADGRPQPHPGNRPVYRAVGVLEKLPGQVVREGGGGLPSIAAVLVAAVGLGGSRGVDNFRAGEPFVQRGDGQ